MKRLYALSLMAVQGNKVSCVAGATAAVSADEATGRGLGMCKRAYPVDEGYSGHEVSVVEIPEKLIASISKTAGGAREKE